MNSLRPQPSFLVPVALFWLYTGLVAAEPPNSLALQARQQLFAAHYEIAANLFSELVTQDPSNGDAWCGLVQAQLAAHRSAQAYAAADEALHKAPQSAGAQTAAGFADYRRGNLSKASHDFEAALKLDPNYAAALAGLARVSSAASMFRTARDLRLRAWRLSPNDQSLMAGYFNSLTGKERIAALAAEYAKLDPATEPARAIASQLAADRALADRKLARLVSPYQATNLKLFRILDGIRHWRGVGLDVRLNGAYTAHLLVDTGASGIAISPKLAEKAGLEIVKGRIFKARGIGDGEAPTSFAYVARDLRIGELDFENYPVSAFRSAASADVDGIIGPDVFRRFIVKIDFDRVVMSLETRPDDGSGSGDLDEPVDFKGKPAPGFYRVFRFGDHLAVPTYINGGRPVLFLVDSGSAANYIDTETAKEFTKVTRDALTIVRGIQGKVNRTDRADQISLVFAGFRQDNPNLLAFSLEGLSDQLGVGFGGILGMPVLGHLAVTIDYREAAIRFEYNKPH